MGTEASVRDRLIAAAADLLSRHGREAVTSRAVSAAAGVQPPAIYRNFGDMATLLNAVADVGFEAYLARKTTQQRTADPIADLRAGWDLHVEFGLEHPSHYVVMYGQPLGDAPSAAATEAHEVLLALVCRVAEHGQLTVSVETAAEMIHAAGMGVVLHLIATPAAGRDLSVSTRTRDAVIAAVTVGESTDLAPTEGVARRANALRVALGDADVPLSPGEKLLLEELLLRLANNTGPRGVDAAG